MVRRSGAISSLLTAAVFLTLTRWLLISTTFAAPSGKYEHPVARAVTARTKQRVALKSYAGYESRFPAPAKNFEQELIATA
jgi:hypothetical protein